MFKPQRNSFRNSERRESTRKSYSNTRTGRSTSRAGSQFKGRPYAGRNAFRNNRAEDDEDEVKPVERVAPVERAIPTFDDLKRQLKAWIENEKIPGKAQAWFTEDATPENCDWRILKTIVKGASWKLDIEAPVKDMKAPEVVVRIFEQIKKEHLHIFCKALRQMLFRATGDGRFALLIQADLRGSYSMHGYKTLIEFLERTCPEIVSCHHIVCTPDYLFDPSSTAPMKVETRPAFGSEFISIAGTGIYMHVLDWAPKSRNAWLKLPLRIENAIHPNREDCFFEFYSGSTFVGASLASQFKKVASLDCREYAMQSSRMNGRNVPDDNMKFYRGHVEAEFFTKFFGKEENEGRWTFYFNLPGDEALATGVEQMAALSRPERILLQTGSLEVAAREIKRFRNESYMLRKLIPLYLEPGTGKFEVLLLFVPDRVGILGLNPAQKNRSRNVQRPQERVHRSSRAEQPHFAQRAPTFKQRKG